MKWRDIPHRSGSIITFLGLIIYDMHNCASSMCVAGALCCCYVSLKWIRKPQTEREGVGVFFAYSSRFVLLWMCSWLCLSVCVWVKWRVCKKKKCFSQLTDHHFQQVSRGFWPLGTWITHFISVCGFHPSMWIFPLFVYECVAAFVCVGCTDDIASPPPPNVIPLPPGPWQTHQTGRK